MFQNETGEDWDIQMHKMCKCGHPFYYHGFVIAYNEKPEQGWMATWVSQCTFCPYDKEKEKFTCEGFDPA